MSCDIICLKENSKVLHDFPSPKCKCILFLKILETTLCKNINENFKANMVRRYLQKNTIDKRLLILLHKEFYINV